jgi:4-hydroxy-3-polyprenylbenzoate decarboxylase
MSEVYDLRRALKKIENDSDQLITTSHPVSLDGQLAGVYRYVGAHGTVKRPTKIGPAMLFENIEGHPDAKVLIGTLASRQRTAKLLDTTPENLAKDLNDAFKKAIPPVVVEEGVCQEEVHLASDPDFDIRKILPAMKTTAVDAGSYITMGLCFATDSENGDSDITIHRLCLQSKDEMTMFFTPGVRHLDVFRKKAEESGKPLPISISVGVDPAIEVGACFEPPTTPLGYNELNIAGGLRGQAVEMVKCKTIDELCIANAEYVIEGELVPGKRIREDATTNLGKAMPEFPGYTGEANPAVPVIKVKAITHRKNPIWRCCIGPSEEHVNLAGIPTEASILSMCERAMPGKVQNVYCPSCGGGKYVAVMQFKKSVPSDEGRQRQAALIAFTAFSELKHVYVVDEDVDIFDMSDVMWAMTTRFQSDVDVVSIPGVRCHPLDPSNSPLYDPSIRDQGIATKTIFDCTVPFDQKHRFIRSEFVELDPSPWLKS